MAKQLNQVSVNLSFTADTKKAQAQMAELQKALSKISLDAAKNNSLGLDKELTSAIEKAAQLKAILASSTTDSGELDLGKFTKSLKDSGTQLKDYAADLVSLGPQGEQAFVQLARSINSANIPLKRSNAMITEFLTTLKNTARWQISSSILHGFMGSVQSAYGYAEDLNESLNNIRIVTGLTTEEMADFAKEANKSAKALSTTTTAYADAALIFYQQGLDDNAVKERTDAVIKMANVTRESETEVSSYMTAIWNNFANEKENLEDYADVITALGAATASSSAEIAGGLEKFAAIGQQIGLSYDYATTALATVVANTRQSEEVVGTALKTIFARIQGLNLGETLEDGTDLNKYSQALAAVGINIKDATGQLKDMDTILDEMGARWQTLAKDEQVALAQTVAGVRQYNQLVALMEAWQTDFQDNLQVAKNSDGALQDQADIYAESWEAARDRVTAAAEGLYDSLLDDKVFILALNGLEGVLGAVENLIDGLGGMGGVILTTGSLLFKYFGPDVANSVNNMIYNMRISSEAGLKAVLDARKKANKELKETFNDSVDNTGGMSTSAVKGKAYGIEADLQDKLLEKTEEMARVGREMDEVEQKKLQIMLDQTRALGEQAIKMAEIAEIKQGENQIVNADISGHFGKQYKNIEGNEGKNLNEDLKNASKQEKQFGALSKIYSNVTKAQNKYRKDTEKLNKYLRSLNDKIKESGEDFDDLRFILTKCTMETESYADIIQELENGLETLGGNSQTAYDEIDNGTGSIEGLSEALKDSQSTAYASGVAFVGAADAISNVENQAAQTEESMEGAKEKAYSFGDGISALGSTILTTSTALTSLIGLGQVWNNTDMSVGEKLLSTITTMAVVVPMLTDAYSKLNLEKVKSLGTSAKDLLLTQAKALGLVAESAGVEVLNGKLTKEIILKTILQALDIKKLLITLAITAALVALVAITMAVVNAIQTQVETEKRAGEMALAAKERYESLRKEFEDLKQSISDYDSALNAFNQLKFGAEGYAEALEEVNKQARELIEANGLYDDWYYGKKGEIKFKDGALENALSTANQKQLDADVTYNALEFRNQRVIQDNYAKDTGSYNLKYGDDFTGIDKNRDGYVNSQAEYGEVETANMSSDDIIDTLTALPQEQYELLKNLDFNSADYSTAYSMAGASEDVYSKEEIDGYKEILEGYDTQLASVAETTGLSVEEILVLSDTIDSLGNESDETVAKLKELADAQGYYSEQMALAGVKQQGLYAGDEAAQRAYANLLSQNEDYVKASNEHAKDSTDRNEDDIKRLLAERDDKWTNYNDGLGSNGFLSDEELMQAYAQYVEGWTKEQLDAAVYKDGWDSGTLTSGDKEISYNDNYMREALEAKLLADQLAQNKDENGDAYYDDAEIKEAIQAVMEADADIKDVAMNALANYQEGQDMNLDWSLLSAEDAEEMRALADEMGGTYGEAITKALEGYTPEQYFERQEMLQRQNLDAQVEEYGLDADTIQTQTELIMQNTAALEDNENAAMQLAINNARMNKGLGTLIKNWKDWKKVLDSGDKTTTEYAETVTELKDILADLVGISDDMAQNISADFFDSADNLALIERAAQADKKAIEELSFAIGNNLVNNLSPIYTMTDDGNYEIFDGRVFENLEDLQSEFNNVRSSVLDDMSKIQEAVANGTLNVGDSVANAIGPEDMASFVSSLNEMAKYTQMSAADMESLLGAYNIEANVGVTTVPVQTEVPQYTTKYTKSGSLVGFAMGSEDGFSVTSSTHVSGYEPVTEQRQVASITYDGSNPDTDINYIDSGNVSTGNITEAETAASSGPKMNSQDSKVIDEEIEEYHVIKNQLEDLSSELDEISRAKERAFGAKKLKLMDQEIEKTQELISKNKEYLAAVKENAETQKDELLAIGAQFDENGTITNYEALMEQAIAEYNKAVEEFNKHTTDDEAAKEEFKKAEDKYAKFKELIEKYEENQDLIKNIEQQIQEQMDAIFDAKLEKVEYVVEIKLDVDDRDLEHLEFLLEMLEDKDFNAAEAIANIGLQTDDILSKIETYKQGINDILKLVGEGQYSVDDILNGNVTLEQLQEGGLTEEGLKQLEEYIDGLADENKALREMRENAWAQVSEEFDEYVENMDNGIEKIEHLKSITESYKNIVDIVGKKFLGVSNDLMDKMHESTVKQSQDLLAANKAKMEALQASYDELKNQDTTGWSDQALKERQDLLDKMEGELQGAKEAFMSSWEGALQASADRYAAAVDNIIAEFEDSIAGLYGTLDELQEAYDRARDLNSQYVEDYEQIYSLTKLTREINEAMDSTDNLEAKAAYRDYLEEINAELESGKQLSEYDIEYRQKKLELIQAEMALNEAKTAKSSVSMVRGEDGNYSYMYTASDEDVADAEQNYEDKLFEMQQLNGDYINNLQEQIIQTQAECAQALATIKESDFNSYEEWRAAVDRTQAFYNQKLDFYYSQLDGTLSNNRNLYEQDWIRYSEATGYKISADENFVDRFSETTYALATGFQTREEAQAAWNLASDQMLLELSTAYATWQQEIDGIMIEAGTSVQGFADTMEEETDRNVRDSEKARDAVEDMAKKMQEDFNETIKKIGEWETTWGQKVDAAIKKNNELITSYQALKQAMAGALDSGDGEDTTPDTPTDGEDTPTTPDTPGGGGDGNPTVGETVTYTGGDYFETSAGSGKHGQRGPGKQVQITKIKEGANYPIHVISSDSAYGWLKKSQLSGFDTGGYTGKWGDSSGRLALLHQKEIVLNAEDTKNFLSAIELVREIANIIDLNAAAASGAFGALSSATSVHGGEREIVQQIEIHAEFPDANNHSEIELAFNNLLNAASQYANRDR